MKTRFGVSYWIDRYPRARQPSYPRLRGSVESSVAIIGAGLTGCAAACAFGLAGIDTVVLEADRVAYGSTGACPGLLRLEPPVTFAALKSQRGLKAARAIWQVYRQAGLDLTATIRRLGIRCEFVPDEAYRVDLARTDARGLARELNALRAAGLDGTWVTPARLKRETGLDGPGAIRSSGDGYVDPYRVSLGLAAAAERRGTRFFERSAVTRIVRGRRGIDVVTAGGSVRVSRVIVAVNDLPRLYRPLQRHLRSVDTYCVLTNRLPSFARRELGPSRAMVIDAGDAPQFLRRTSDDRLLAVGADHPSQPLRSRAKALVQQTAHLMYGVSRLYPAMSGVQPEYGWNVPMTVSADRLPIVGPHRMYPGHLFAIGLGHGGVGAAWLAAQALVRFYGGVETTEDRLFGFSRLRMVSTAGRTPV